MFDIEARTAQVELLRRAVLTAERGAARPGVPTAAAPTMLWQGVADGRWSIIDQFEEGSRRYVVARRNPRATWPSRALSAREQQVVRLAARGDANKHIAYDLHLSTSTVSTLLSTALRKLGVRSRVHLMPLFSSLAE